MSKLKKLFVLALPAVLLAGVTFGAAAQSTTQGSIAGTVEDPTTAVIPKAAVTILNEGTNANFKVTADDSGFFKAPLLEPGSYTVTIAATGFGTYVADHVVVQVGQVTTLMPKLTAGSAEQTVNVSSDATTLNFQSPDMTAVLTSSALEGIPVQNRRWSSLALTTPGVVADSSGFGLISVRGMSTLLNNIEVDGADDNQAYFSEERGRTREGYSTSANAVREFEVNTGVYSAQYGRAAGGVINSVTKSGTNQFHGDVIFNDLDKGFGAYTPGSISPTGQPLKPKDLRKIYGFSVGGPILKDKLFFFYTYDQLTHINPAISKANAYQAVGTTPGFLTTPDPTVTTCTVNATTGAVTVTGATATASGALDTQVCALQYRLGLASYAAAANYYNAGVTALTTDLGIVPRAGYQEINTPKLDWQINSKERASFLFHRLRWDAPGDVQTTSSASYSLDAFGNDFVKLDYGVAKLDSQLTSRITNELLYQYSRELNDEGQQPYSTYTTNNLEAPGGGAILGGMSNAPGGATIPYIALDTSIGFNMGSPYYSYRIAYPDERKWQVEDVLYYQLGNHSLRMGGDFVHNYDILRQTPYYFGDYSYSNLANYLTDLATKGKSQGSCNSAGSGVGYVAGSGVAPAVGGYECYSSAYQDFGATKFNLATQDYAGFVQDNWKATSRLTLELGVRYDYQSLPPTPSYLTSAAGTFVPYAGITNAPQDKNNFGPRIGFAYDVYGTGNTVLRGGYGLYYGRILNGTVATVEFGTGSPVGQYQLASTKPSAGCTTSVAGVTSGCAAPIFPNPFAAGAGSKPSSFFLAPNLQNPAVHEFDLQLQQQLGHGTVFQISYLGAMGRTLPNFLNVNLAPPEVTSYVQINGGPATGQLNAVPTFGTCTASATCPYPTGYINSNFSNITEVISNINSSYNGFVAEIQNRSFHGLQFDGNYTWSHALDFNQNASSTTSTNNWLNPYAAARQNYGISQFNVGNRFVGYAIYNFPDFVKSGPLKYAANGWGFNDTFQMQTGLPYSATIGSGFNSAAALNSSYNGVNSVYYIPTIGINTYKAPRAIVDDMRLQKSFRFADHYDLQLAADVYNIANHENYNVGNVNNTAYNFGTSSGTIGTTAANPTPLNYQATFGTKTGANNSGFLYTPREIQLGARLEF